MVKKLKKKPKDRTLSRHKKKKCGHCGKKETSMHW